MAFSSLLEINILIRHARRLAPGVCRSFSAVSAAPAQASSSQYFPSNPVPYQTALSLLVKHAAGDMLCIGIVAVCIDSGSAACCLGCKQTRRKLVRVQHAQLAGLTRGLSDLTCYMFRKRCKTPLSHKAGRAWPKLPCRLLALLIN